MYDSYFSYLGQGKLTFLDRISCLFWSSVCPTVISHIWDMKILAFLDRISCLFWSSVCPTVISHIWAKEY